LRLPFSLVHFFWASKRNEQDYMTVRLVLQPFTEKISLIIKHL
jgi:hypothetical protein